MRLLAATLVVGLALFAGCSGDDGQDAGTSTAPNASVPTVVPTASAGETIDGGAVPDGFSTVTARITSAAGEVSEVCLWLADSSDERALGLMGVTDLGDAAGMAFVFEEPTSGSFYMFQTPTPLSIAWFAPGGRHVGSADMTPCLDLSPGDCARYSPGAAYDLAIEVFEGGLADLGIGPGSTAVIAAGSESPTCLAAAPR